MLHQRLVHLHFKESESLIKHRYHQVIASFCHIQIWFQETGTFGSLALRDLFFARPRHHGRKLAVPDSDQPCSGFPTAPGPKIGLLDDGWPESVEEHSERCEYEDQQDLIA